MAKKRGRSQEASGQRVQRPILGSPVKEPPLSVGGNGKVFRDPIHHLIRITPADAFVLDLIDTPEVQRLRRVRQLGVSWLTYHGAEHSRFTHSLDVFNFAQRIIEALQSRYGHGSDVYGLLDKHGRAIRAAALVHDVGHAPFSHMLERAFGKSHHEDRTIEFIQARNSGLNGVLRKHGIEPDDVASIIRKDFPDKLAVDIVSSQLDADRMDYLLRDSYCTGVGYGEYDADWLLHSMCVGRVMDGTTPGPLKLCLDRGRGVYAAERFIIARMHMYQQVYMHRVTRGFEVLVLNLFKAAAHRSANGGLPTGTPALVHEYFEARGNLPSERFLRFDESQVVSAFHCWAESGREVDQTLRRLASAFLNRERLYAAVTLTLTPTGFMTLGQRLEALPKEADGATPIWGVDSVEDTSYKGVLWRSKKHNDNEAVANLSILLADPAHPESAAEAEGESSLLRQIDAQSVPVTRLYFDRARFADLIPLAEEFNLTLSEARP